MQYGLGAHKQAVSAAVEMREYKAHIEQLKQDLDKTHFLLSDEKLEALKEKINFGLLRNGDKLAYQALAEVMNLKEKPIFFFKLLLKTLEANEVDQFSKGLDRLLYNSVQSCIYKLEKKNEMP